MADISGFLGAVIGDIVGSPYEFDINNIKTESFPLFSEDSHFTDDTVLTIAVALGLAAAWGKGLEAAREAVTSSMRQWCLRYPHAGYGARFCHWMHEPKPYESYGNGAAMRVSAVGWLCNRLEEVLALAEVTAAVSHNHPEGIKGAQATAAAIFLTRQGCPKAELKAYIERQFGYDLSRRLEDIRPAYRHVESCQQTVPEAITAYLESASFEDCLRKAVSLGGDSDTLAAIAASIAGAAYPIPGWIKEEALARLDAPLAEALARFEKFYGGLTKAAEQDICEKKHL